MDGAAVGFGKSPAEFMDKTNRSSTAWKKRILPKSRYTPEIALTNLDLQQNPIAK